MASPKPGGGGVVTFNVVPDIDPVIVNVFDEETAVIVSGLSGLATV